ncbi:MAG: succinate dehydrogenase assembly factor 2 [Proteobacteria bacterium]|nr:succinate dehydrogenase assembly factor 2 [Pseudomonadota bacterium]
MQKSRLRWQCRRGMRELDELLTSYLARHYDEAGDGEKEAFRQLLELSDPELAGYLLGTQIPGSERITNVVERILCRTSS